MQIKELDEFQGLTPQTVREWLLSQGWAQTKPGWFAKGEDGFLYDPQTFDRVYFWLYALAAVHDLTIQGMLREINPRMRKGMPSDAAINAHADRHWVAKSSQRGGVTRIIEIAMGRVVMVQTLSETQRIDLNHLPDGWHYWPCDEHGNKVRWPTDENGDML